MNKTEFYQNHLSQVSRSFAWCISKLEGDFREWVSLSYLLLRVLDTVEDSAWASNEKQNESFDLFLRFCREGQTSTEFDSWIQSLPEDIPAEELSLVKDLPVLIKNLSVLPQPISALILRCLSDMSCGMKKLKSLTQQGFKNIYQLNQYCFFVAGIVGELLSRLQNEREIRNSNLSEKKLLQSHHFGLFLQKINILKDHLHDAKEGRKFAFDSKEIISSLAQDAQAAIEYIIEIPVRFRDYRLFCATSFFLGIYSLPWIEKTWATKIFEKIPRTVTESLLGEIQNVVDDNQALLDIFKKKFKIYSVPAVIHSTQDLSWFSQCYSGHLPTAHLTQLGLTPKA